ncbi:hypothetical protein H8356DRAFT_1079122 [Neocallimastix lanati (nom. inval.)]|uniref:Uncharacterized protein n=1 Tax=Neocallimastix californiae TaxID=1754190 RepID=A0A1Y2ASD5_9FUNG|nr:hypothetical protein H8356DRAFT_1079122 [Neocallimastix sp. JGI-2020a]ORY25210.1 hypothetical protein LY90DRAFT_514250 [Neocallimastix californiae]|eukprot:ORY25210.1 hypothetical protein LY90DRAFT_514250 [Neocallimastix californiae]
MHLRKLTNADSCINKNKEEKDLGNNTFIKVFTIIMFIFTIVSILEGICIVFKYGYLVILVLNVMDRLCSWTSTSENEKNKKTCTNLCCSIFILIIHIVYYVLVINYISNYEAYLKN